MGTADKVLLSINTGEQPKVTAVDLSNQLPLRSRQVRAVLLKHGYVSSASSLEGIWMALLQSNYDEAIPHAACSARNLIDSAAKEVQGLGGEPNFDPYSHVDGLESKWGKLKLPTVIDDTKFYKIPGKFLMTLKNFFTIFSNRETHRSRIKDLVQSTDSEGFPIDQDQLEQIITKLTKMRIDFGRILHQDDKVDRKSFIEQVNELESILMDFILRRTPVDNLDLIDQLVNQVEDGK